MSVRAPVPSLRNVLHPRSGTSAKAVLITILGRCVEPRGGEAWTTTLIAALAAVGVEARNARQALGRLGEQGIVTGRREGRRVRRVLTPAALEMFRIGRERIFTLGDGTPDWDHRWLVVLCSVPEEHRPKRHLLRSRLAFAGFGFIGAGVAISPHVEREQLASDVVRELDLVANATVFISELGELVPASTLLDRAWDLAALADEYRVFVRAFEGRAPTTRRARFAATIDLVHRWRRFVSIDPELPDELLPSRWPGHRARQVFDDCHGAWQSDALGYFEELESEADA